MKSKFLAVVLFCSFAFSAFAGAPVELVDAVNQNGITSPLNRFWPADVGWEYTPPVDYILTGVFTKFSYIPYNDNRTVTVEIYDGLPSDGGRLLRSADFKPLANAFSGALFPPTNLRAGHAYFIGFRNVANLGQNIARYEATVLSPFYYSQFDDGTYSFSESGYHSSCPILEFFGRIRGHGEDHGNK
jgi:hypothetical protein